MNRTWLLFEKIFAVVELLITVLITCILYQTELEKGVSECNHFTISICRRGGAAIVQ
jgi:hypothetical protein